MSLSKCANKNSEKGKHENKNSGNIPGYGIDRYCI